MGLSSCSKESFGVGFGHAAEQQLMQGRAEVHAMQSQQEGMVSSGGLEHYMLVVGYIRNHDYFEVVYTSSHCVSQGYRNKNTEFIFCSMPKNHCLPPREWTVYVICSQS
jgi:hypothetical protein